MKFILIKMPKWNKSHIFKTVGNRTTGKPLCGRVKLDTEIVNGFTLPRFHSELHDQPKETLCKDCLDKFMFISERELNRRVKELLNR